MSQINVNTIATAAGVEQARLVQVQTVNKTTRFTTASASFVDVTGFSVAITPTNSANKILVFVSTQIGNASAGGYGCECQLVRDTTAIALGTGSSAGGHNYTTFSLNGTGYESEGICVVFLDDAQSTSAHTYKFQIKAGGGTAALGGRGDDATYSNHSTITVMEIRT